MEKDYFKDRHPLVNDHNAIMVGDEVFICLKNMQPYAKELQDLTKITVSNYLTSQQYHPRGQKVKGIETIWDEKNKEYIQEERVGRITYKIIDGYIVPTKEGYKYIEKYSNKKLKLSTFDEISEKFILFAVLKFDKFLFKISLDDWTYYNSLEKAQEYIKTININNIKLYSDRIYLNINERPFEFKRFEIFINEKRIKIEKSELFEYLTNNYKSSNQTIYSFNKYFDLDIISYELRKREKYN